LPYDPERELFAASYRAKQLVVLAADGVLEAVALRGREPEAVADELTMARVLPLAERPRYDQAFLTLFHNVVETTRNVIVTDIPSLACTASELAANAILQQARAILEVSGRGWEDRAAGVHPDLPEQLEANRDHLASELDLLEVELVEDRAVLDLFETPEAGCGGLATEAGSLLRFENWLIPYGRCPRPYISYDGRAWPAEV
jgi:hypothetical protein